MKRSMALFFLAATAIWAQKPLISHEVMSAVEESFDNRIKLFSADDPLDLLGTTRGIYLEGYGVVVTAEVNLVMAAGITPFHQTFTKEEIARLHQKKLQRLEALKQIMMEQLAGLATSLNTLPPNEQVVLGVILVYRPWEDATGLPRQVVMQAPRKALLGVQKASLRSAIHVQEY
jgi:hypothetical protein